MELVNACEILSENRANCSFTNFSGHYLKGTALNGGQVGGQVVVYGLAPSDLGGQGRK